MFRMSVSLMSVAVVCAGATAASAQPTQQWETIVPSSYATGATVVAMTAGGDPNTVYVTGAVADNETNQVRRWLTAAVDAGSGQQVWTAVYPPRPPARSRQNRPTAFALDSDGRTVYVTGLAERQGQPEVLDYTTVAYDAATGNLLWEARLPMDEPYVVAPTLAAANGVVYLTGTESRHYLTVSYDGITGQPLWTWSYDRGSEGHGQVLTVDPDGSLYVGGWVITTGPSTPQKWGIVKIGWDPQP